VRAAARWIVAAGLLLIVAPVAPASAFTRTVQIRSNQYQPASKQARIGDTVEWTNHDQTSETPTPQAHTVTSDAGSGETFDLHIAPGKTGSYTFTKAGTFPYHCTIVQGMHGSILVPAEATTLPAAATTLRPTTTRPPATTTSQPTTSTSQVTTTVALDTTTSEETTSTTVAGQVAIKTPGPKTNGLAVAGLLVAIAATLGGGG
jgi:plastocyanin